MKRLIFSLIIIILVSGIILTAYAPDAVSAVFIVMMELIVFGGVFLGILPVVSFYRAFETGLDSIARALEVQTSSTWSAISQIEEFFHQRTMDSLFRAYREKIQFQKESGQILSDIEEYISEDSLALRSWQSIVHQIPGTLTGLGILGTFIGLIIGIRGIGFSSVNEALSSVQILLSGIQVAFYTSIAGVILSLLFNFLYRIAWNAMLRNMGLFIDDFHKNVIPSVEEQQRYRERKEILQITELLERLPKAGALPASGSSAAPQQGGDNEQVLMPQIVKGLQEGEFVFFLQPRYKLASRKVIGAEALVRWNHPRLGTVAPNVFIPILENNGYIAKLDQYIWELVCATIRRWIDSGLRPVPITINVTKTDILALDIAKFFVRMLKKYRIPPYYLEIDIAESAYFQSTDAVLDTEAKLKSSGFRVAMDGFNGDYVALEAVENLKADVLKLNLRQFSGNQNQAALNALFEQARKLKLTLSVEGIESMEQLGMLRKCGCTEGQGFFLSKPVPVEEFESMMAGEKDS